MKCKHCEEQAEWLDEYCQMHWEAYSSGEWWTLMDELAQVLEKERKR